MKQGIEANRFQEKHEDSSHQQLHQNACTEHLLKPDLIASAACIVKKPLNGIREEHPQRHKHQHHTAHHVIDAVVLNSQFL